MSAARIGVLRIVVGIESSVSRFSTNEVCVVMVSTVGDWALTVTVSSTAPTCNSAFTAAVKFPSRMMPARRTLLKPGSVKVTVYSPGRRSMIWYWPLASVATLRDFSMSAGLDASTVTPGMTAPVVSLTDPAMATWARPLLANSKTAAHDNDAHSTIRLIALTSYGQSRVLGDLVDLTVGRSPPAEVTLR